ncbi:MAG TPA: DNA translocase FtsK 4TM domain-containing protein [Myxococcota bacterium]|nr:DNA translocase FtsK 4TM domain-containing protein [Myxococcota bacterium]
MSSTTRYGSRKSQGAAQVAESRQNEIVGVVFCLAAALVLLSLSSFSPSDPVFDGIGEKASNLFGLVGAYLGAFLFAALGLAAFLLVGGLVYGAVVAFSRGGVRVSARKVTGGLLLTILGTVFCQLVFSGDPILGHPPGGVVGEYMGGLFISLLSVTGTAVVVTAGMLLCLIAATGFSPVNSIRFIGRYLRIAAIACGRATVLAAGRTWRAAASAARRSFTLLVRETRELLAGLRESRASVSAAAQAKPGEKKEPWFASPTGVEVIDPDQGRREPVVVTSDPGSIAEPAVAGATHDKGRPEGRHDQEPEIVIPRRETKQPAAAARKPEQTFNLKGYKLPDIDFLDSEDQGQNEIEKEQLHEYARRLEEKLASYGVEGKVKKIMPGPVVTMYEYVPAPGVKVSKIAGLSDDMALALGALSVRIVAPIPGRSVVGIEVANKQRQTVFAKEIIAHHSFQRSNSKLTLALGKNIEGAPFVTDLNKMPHLLVAGATGTGKSVALNAMITSILYRATPEDVRFIMVDPKMLELSLYEDIPHLLLPVVIDPRKAQAALNWAVCEMERRIQLLHAVGVRSLDSYNLKAERLNSGQSEEQSGGAVKKVIVIDKTATAGMSVPPAEEDNAADAGESSKSPNNDAKLEKLPHIVIVIDELADLMMTASREVETSIARIAQKARAAGIHLIVATQRPSVNVITGLIKANLPARISFRVASKIDSRTILDCNGAETLVGNGDMLFHPPTSSQIIRIHGALITEDEITRVVQHLKEQAQPVYDDSILASTEEDSDDLALDDEDRDELYDLAVAVVAEAGQASTSMVQRKLRIGYNRAARLVERMEREGIVGPPDGSRPREVLIRDHAS